MHKFGHYLLPEGRNLLIKIASSINKFRYSTAKGGAAVGPTLEILNTVLDIDAPFNVESGLSHTLLAQQFSLARGSRKGFPVYVYVNGVEIESSPFPSYYAASKALGLSNRVIFRYIDTSRTYKGYLFYSAPLSVPK